MSLQPEPSVPADSPTPAPPLSLMQRFGAVFARPGAAWGGLRERSQWWFPLLVVGLLNVLIILPLYDRALVPDMMTQWEAQVEAGAMQPAQMDQAETMVTSLPSRIVSLVFAGIGPALFTLGIALVISFGVGFILGSKLPFRLALEVASWAGLVKLVEYPLVFLLAWTQESFKSVHLSLAAFLTAPDPPAKWHVMLTSLLDAVGPFNIWYVAVIVLGCAALTGAPRRNVAWVLGGLGVALAVVSALLAGWLSPAA